MPTLTLINSNPSGAIWLDARFSNGGTPFSELKSVPGFPRWLKDGETIKIETGDWKEILYLRSFRPTSLESNPPLLPFLWRISLGDGDSDRIGRVFSAGAIERSDAIGPYSYLQPQPANQVKRETLLPDCSHETSKFEIKAFVRNDGFGEHIVQVFVEIVDKKTGRKGRRMIIEAPELYAYSLCGRFRIKKDKLFVFSRTTKLHPSSAASYRDRGFSVPIQVPLNEIL